MLKWVFFRVFKKRERQQSVFLRSYLKYFLWLCFVFVRVLFTKKGFWRSVCELWKIRNASLLQSTFYLVFYRFLVGRSGQIKGLVVGLWKGVLLEWRLGFYSSSCISISFKYLNSSLLITNFSFFGKSK